METKDVILKLRTERGLSQEALAERVFVTRQAVSRWENGETVPNTETLKLLSRLFDVSINTLLGAPRALICQCCGMPLEDATISKETNGSFNEDYCKWCYADGEYTYDNMDELIEFCAGHLASEQVTSEQIRAHMRELLPSLGYWKHYAGRDGARTLDALKRQLIDEFNALGIEGMPEVTALSALVGAYVNLEYPLPGGARVKLLDDSATYLGYQLESETQPGRCFGLVANADLLLVCSYGENGAEPELLLYRRR